MSFVTNPRHPGTVLKTLWLDPLGLSSIALSKRLGVPRTRIERLVKGQTGMTPDTALRLGKFFGTSPQMWINMQMSFDLAQAASKADLDAIEPLEAA
ncbi:MAG: HigA family addiction module antitoxin [Litorimonas sp.]